MNPLSHMGPPIMSAGGKSGLNFDDVLHKLQVGLVCYATLTGLRTLLIAARSPVKSCKA